MRSVEEAHRALRGAVAGVREDSWQAPMPVPLPPFTVPAETAAGAADAGAATSLLNYLGRRADWTA